MPFIPGLRSGYSLVGGVVHFGRMLDKIRLHAANRLPGDYQAGLGTGFDGRTCAFLGISYADLRTRTLAGGCDEEILAWARATGTANPTDDQISCWNLFMAKLGWRDDRTAILRQRIASSRLTGHPIETFFDLNDFDEGRDPVAARAWEFREPRIVLLMGVAGSGKTTVGNALATDLGWRFTDADDFHPAANIAKMSAGTPLTDADRAPWLAALHAHLESRRAAHDNTVIACSALRAAYRELLVADPGVVKIVHLQASRTLLEQRLAQRTAHFTTAQLLDSQLATLEPPANALTLDASAPVETLVKTIRFTFRL